MKFAIVLLVVCIGYSSAQLGSRITLETIDVEGMLRNPRLVRKQIDCVLERGRCDINGRDLKAFLPEAIGDDCEDCSPRVKANVDRVINYMKVNHPAEWAQIYDRYSR